MTIASFVFSKLVKNKFKNLIPIAIGTKINNPIFVL